MKRRAVQIAVAATAAALALTACSAQSGGSAKTTLSVVAADYGTGPANTSQKYWEGLATEFHKTHPDIDVKVQTIAWSDFDTKVQTMVQNHQYPDVVEGDYFNAYAKAGLLYKAEDVLSPATHDNLLSAFTNLGTYDGAQYGMPFTTSAQALFYNKKLFAQAGISTPPATWDDVQADAKKIAALGKIGLGLPLGPEAADGEAFMWMLGNGGEYQTSSGSWVIDSKANVATFDFLTKLTNAGLTQPNPGTSNRTDLWQQFAQGEIGFMNDGQGALIPIIRKAGVLTDADWGTAPLVGRTKALDTTLGVADQLYAFKGDGSKKAALKQFLDFTYLDKNQLAFDREYILLPATTSAAKALSTDPVFAPFLTALPNARQLPSDPVWTSLQGKLKNTIGTAVTSDPAAVLGTLQQAATGK